MFNHYKQSLTPRIIRNSTRQWDSSDTESTAGAILLRPSQRDIILLILVHTEKPKNGLNNRKTLKADTMYFKQGFYYLFLSSFLSLFWCQRDFSLLSRIPTPSFLPTQRPIPTTHPLFLLPLPFITTNPPLPFQPLQLPYLPLYLIHHHLLLLLLLLPPACPKQP